MMQLFNVIELSLSILLQSDPLAPLVQELPATESNIKLIAKYVLMIGSGGVFLFGTYRVFYEEGKSGVILIVLAMVLGAMALAMINAA